MSKEKKFDAHKKLKACQECGILQTDDEFKAYGCPNCKKNFSTTPNFKGIIAITNPKGSYAARVLGKTKYMPGKYCLDMLDKRDDEEIDEGMYDYEDDVNDEESENYSKES